MNRKLLKLEDWCTPRCLVLRNLEGWYSPKGNRAFKVSCRFKDILRCSTFNGKRQHFASCYSKGNTQQDQPTKRCVHPNWAIVYVPDKHGNYLGRCFVEFEWVCYLLAPWPTLTLYFVYGNRLRVEEVKRTLRREVWWTRLIRFRYGPPDKTL